MSPRRDDAPPGGEGLAEYRRKRDPEVTPEPFEGEAASEQPRFVVQRHSARRLHYDLRLERDGVLASWAVPKGLPTSPGARRLAVHTEDHPLKYIDFEGQIPKGQYGAGTMDVYDTGPYEVVEERKDGGLTIRLHGEVLQGVWTLVPARMDGDRKNWLLIRRRDDEAPITRAAPGKKYEPMLAALAEKPPPAAGWICEVKLDGFRALARLGDGEVELWSRRGNDLTTRFKPVADDLGRGLRSPNAVVDGEVVAVGPDGKPSFSLLQTSEGRLLYYVFDLLELDGESWCDRPLEERRERLRELVDATSKTVRFSDAFPDPAALLEVARQHELEGIICKRAGSRYLPGKRTRDWLKIKARPSQEFVVAGYTVGQGKRARFGALVLAVHDEQGNLRYVGNCGTGFTRERDRPPHRAARAAPARHAAALRSPPRPPAARPERGLGRAGPGVRGRVRRVDARRPRAGPGLQGPARGQAPVRDRPRDRRPRPCRGARPRSRSGRTSTRSSSRRTGSRRAT